MSGPVIPCPMARCRADNPFDADECERCGTPVRGHARLTAYTAYLFNRGLAAARAGRLTVARDHFAAVVHWCPTDTEARNALALAGYRLGDVTEARRHWELVCERRPDDPLARRGLSLVVEGSS
ncbi:hypothetical protein D0T12_01660 [Actinomadura spongiicola]|uniref:Uncharacterized protein n=1 Tax=Actinomadura spongiicola TaxID=2303421 RepID=A0A372GNK9_9ACTN|nr:hypothetical protein [Actinomadura spongiicola]RFS86990.1 hypothetical protein D0T12_01660 [Actinomadura spongiicola]